MCQLALRKHLRAQLHDECNLPDGELTLAFGPMKPVGLTDPKTGRRPFAVVQLRAGTKCQDQLDAVDCASPD